MGVTHWREEFALFYGVCSMLEIAKMDKVFLKTDFVKDCEMWVERTPFDSNRVLCVKPSYEFVEDLVYLYFEGNMVFLRRDLEFLLPGERELDHMILLHEDPLIQVFSKVSITPHTTNSNRFYIKFYASNS